tara:strand:+ start:1654 stop:2751 length:1098 start_codon:yes stop_codon:yes gene_type:complete
VQTVKPTQFDKTQDEKGNDLPPGTIRVRINNVEGAEEHYAYPSDPNRVPIPLYGEQVLLLSAYDGEATIPNQNKFYYTATINTQGQVNNSILPFMQDSAIEGGSYAATAITAQGKGQKPEQFDYTEKDITYIQPFQGDTNYQDRFGSVLRFSSTHDDISKYKKKPFWEGSTPNDPFVALTNGVKDSRTGKSIDKYYSIENPMDDAGYIYMSSTQKFKKFKLSQDKVGANVLKMNEYDKPQVIIGSDRLIFNARIDEIVLVSKKDVKVATPNWKTDMDEFFTQMLRLIEEVIEQNKNLEAAHKEIDKVATTDAKSTHSTGVGNTAVPNEAGEYKASSAKAKSNASTTVQIRTRIEKIKAAINEMEQ